MINKKIKSQEKENWPSCLQRDSVFSERAMLKLEKEYGFILKNLLGISQFIFLYSLETVFIAMKP
jgi:hypothetical protein